MFKSACCWATGGGVIGGAISVIVNNALIEISLTPLFRGAVRVVLLLLGSLMIWRKLWERHETGCTRVLVLSFLASSSSPARRASSSKDWFKRIPPRAKVPLYVSLGVSLCFSITFTCVDLLNAYYDRNSYDLRRRALVQTPQQVGVVLAGAVANGAALWLHVRDDGRRGRAAALAAGGAALGADWRRARRVRRRDQRGARVQGGGLRWREHRLAEGGGIARRLIESRN